MKDKITGIILPDNMAHREGEIVLNILKRDISDLNECKRPKLKGRRKRIIKVGNRLCRLKFCELRNNIFKYNLRFFF